MPASDEVVTMTHPTLPGREVTATRHQFDAVWKDLGWELADGEPDQAEVRDEAAAAELPAVPGNADAPAETAAPPRRKQPTPAPDASAPASTSKEN